MLWINWSFSSGLEFCRYGIFISGEIVCNLQGPNSRKDPLGSTSTSGLKNGHYLVSTGKVTGESPPVSGTNVKTASSEKEQTEKQLS